MDTRSEEMFSMTRVFKWDDSRYFVKDYDYIYFRKDVIDHPWESFDDFVETTIKILKNKQKQVHSLKAISIDIIKNDISKATYDHLKNCKIDNVFQLRTKLSQAPNGKVYSYIRGIGRENGLEILAALDKNNITKNIYTEKIKLGELNEQTTRV